MVATFAFDSRRMVAHIWSGKTDRLKTHLIYAEQNGVLEEISVFLKNLNQDQWIYEGDV